MSRAPRSSRARAAPTRGTSAPPATPPCASTARRCTRRAPVASPPRSRRSPPACTRSKSSCRAPTKPAASPSPCARRGRRGTRRSPAPARSWRCPSPTWPRASAPIRSPSCGCSIGPRRWRCCSPPPRWRSLPAPRDAAAPATTCARSSPIRSRKKSAPRCSSPPSCGPWSRRWRRPASTPARRRSRTSCGSCSTTWRCRTACPWAAGGPIRCSAAATRSSCSMRRSSTSWPRRSCSRA